MSTLDDMEVGSPDWEAEVERLQIAEDAERDAAAQKASDEAAAAKAAKDAEDEAAAAAAKAAADEAAKAAKAEEDAAAEVAAAGKPEGVLGKDGKTVLPYAALKGARTEARQERLARTAAEARAAALEQELADLRAGKKPAEPIKISDKDLAELDEFNPAAAKAARAVQQEAARLAEENAALKKTVAPTKEAPADEGDDPVQDAIDSIPLLAEWQASDPEKFARAVAHDTALKTSPKFKGFTPEAYAKRFSRVVELVADEYDIQMPIPPQPKPKELSKADPKEAIAKAAVTPPNTLSDFKGGAHNETDDKPVERLPARDQLAAVSSMSKEDFDAYLARLS